MFRDMCLRTFCYPNLIIMLTPQEFQQGFIIESNKMYLQSVRIHNHYTTLSALKHVDGGGGSGNGGGAGGDGDGSSSGGGDVDADVNDNNNM